MDAQSKQEFLELYQDAHEPLARFCMAKSYGVMDPSDLLSETVLAALEGFDKLRNKKAFLSYLFTIANNKVNAVLRRRKFSGPYEEQVAHSQIDTNGASDARFDISRLYEALNELPDNQREAVILFEISGFSIKEIMEIQNSGASAVKQRLKRGREKLALLFNEDKRKAMVGVVVLLLSQNANSTPSVDTLFEIVRSVDLPISQEQIITIINNYQSLGLVSTSSFTHVAHLGVSGISMLAIVGAVCFNGGKTSLNVGTASSVQKIKASEALTENTIDSRLQLQDQGSSKIAVASWVGRSEMNVLPASALSSHPNALELLSTSFPVLSFQNHPSRLENTAPSDTTKYTSTKSEELTTGSVVKAKLWDADVTVIVWDNDYVDIQSNITYDAKNEKSKKIAEEYLKVTIEKKGNDLDIMGKSCCKNVSSSFMKFERWTFSNGDKAYLRNVEMQHTLYVPKDVQLNLDVAYGDLTLPNLQNDLILKLSNGDLIAGDVSGQLDLQLRYSHAEMGTLGSGKMSLFESNLDFTEANDIDLESRYSDLMTTKINRVKIDANNGKFLVEEVQELTGNLRYMKCISKTVDLVDLKVHESKFTADFIEKMRLNSGYSQYNVQSLESLELSKSHEDHITIDNVKWIDGTSRYSRIKIGQLQTSAELNSHECNVHIDEVSKNFTTLNFEGNYTNYDLNFAEESGYELNVNARYTGLSYPKARTNISKWVDENNVIELKGRVNESNAKDAVVMFHCFEGKIVLVE